MLIVAWLLAVAAGPLLLVGVMMFTFIKGWEIVEGRKLLLERRPTPQRAKLMFVASMMGGSLCWVISCVIGVIAFLSYFITGG